MKIDAKLVKELREKTGVGLMDCKKALTETDGDITKAVELLKTKGQAKAAKKTERKAAEGLCFVLYEGNNGVIFEINSETDFVAKNKNFREMMLAIGEVLLKSDAQTLNQANQVKIKDTIVKDYIVSKAAIIGENLVFRRFLKLSKTDAQHFASYAHQSADQILSENVSIMVLNGENFDEDLGKVLCMHVTSIKPKYLTLESIPDEIVEKTLEEVTAKFHEERKQLVVDLETEIATLEEEGKAYPGKIKKAEKTLSKLEKAGGKYLDELEKGTEELDQLWKDKESKLVIKEDGTLSKDQIKQNEEAEKDFREKSNTVNERLAPFRKTKEVINAAKKSLEFLKTSFEKNPKEIERNKNTLDKENSKKDDILSKILQGKFNKTIKEDVLEHQVYIKAAKKEKVIDVLKKNKLSVVTFARFEVGEGLEEK